MNEVYVIAGGEWLRNNLNAIAAFMSTRTWDSIEKIALTLSVLAVAVMWVQRHNVMDLLGWVAVFVLISLLVNVRTSVQIIDNSDLVKVHRVDNVPVGLAMPLSLTTRIGHAMVASYEMIFTQPDSVTYSKTGMLFGAELVSKSTDFLSRNPEIAEEYINFMLSVDEDPTKSIAAINAEYICYATPNMAVQQDEVYRYFVENEMHERGYELLYSEDSFNFEEEGFIRLDEGTQQYLNECWDRLKIQDSGESSLVLPIVCGVVAAAIIAVIVVVVIRKKKKEKYYQD